MNRNTGLQWVNPAAVFVEALPDVFLGDEQDLHKYKGIHHVQYGSDYLILLINYNQLICYFFKRLYDPFNIPVYTSGKATD